MVTPFNTSVRQTPFFSLQFIQIVMGMTGGTIVAFMMVSSSILAGGLIGLAISFRNLPDVRTLQYYIPTETSYIYDVKGELLASIHGEANRDVISLEQISPNLKRAVLAIEDGHFYHHGGVNPVGVGRALLANFSSGRTVEGGSTITMQLVKNLLLTPERALSRKVAEAVLALRVEQILTKDQIFELYLNQVYWGHNNYGVETAARSYFNKSAKALTLAESAMMAGLIQAPEDFSPFVDFKLAKQRQSIVLRRLRELQWITDTELQRALSETIRLGQITSFQSSRLPYVTDAVTQELNKRFGRDTLPKGGMRIQTTVDAQLQRFAENVVKRGHQSLKNQGIDVDQMALVAIDPRTHFVKAIVGGVDYKTSQFNRALQSKRQPGSAFKPFVFYAAFASGRYTPESLIKDTPVSYADGNEIYVPRNYDGSFSGEISLRRALEVSRNIPAVRLGQAIGLDQIINICQTIGIESPIPSVLSLPLGSVDLTPMEITGAYATLANYGWYSPVTMIVQVTDSGGNVLLDNTPKPKLVLDPWSTAAVTDVMQGVITRGTGTAAQIGRPAAGKTGTTSSERDIWFIGYVPQLVAAVWAGNDNYEALGYGATGGRLVAPIWRDFMEQAMKGVAVEPFKPPSVFERP
ncbi:MAG: penicillin-binding protein 1A [Cyanobacteria bacterium WB6_1B_304]|jgi:penicillin-binding protein 1A|nr:penicillin-binding protein 1A [Cyanobacteria bacterium WB6_1B_304]